MFSFGLRFYLVWAAIGIAMTDECKEPPSFPNSNFAVNGDVVTYHCYGGYKFDGITRESTCKEGLWEKIKFTCAETCGSHPDIPNAKVIHSQEDSVIYKCQDTFSTNSNADIEIKCDGAAWATPKEQCWKSAQPVTDIPTSFHETTNGTTLLPENSTLLSEDAVSCNGSYCGQRMELNESSLCIDGFISGTNVSCTSNNSESCQNPKEIPNSVILWNDGKTVTYHCNPAYEQVGDISIIYCENGTWTETDMTCILSDSGDCPEPKKIPNSVIKKYDEGKIEYICEPGYMKMENISISSCENGTWTEIDVICFPESCGPLYPVPGSVVTAYGNTANFTCGEEFVQRGDVSTSFCENGTWTNVDTTCVSEEQLAEEYRHYMLSLAFQGKLETSNNTSNKLICSFNGIEQSCRCNEQSAIMVEIRNRKIAKHNAPQILATTLTMCESFCLRDIGCLSLEYDESTYSCWLSKTASYLVENLLYMNAPGVIYGEKFCVASSSVTVQVKPVMRFPTFDLSEVQSSSLVCSIGQEGTFCGCVNGTVSMKKYPYKKIAMHNMLSFPSSNHIECINACLQTENCLSAEYKIYKRLCRLSQTSRYLVDELIFLDSRTTHYYEKICIPFPEGIQTNLKHGLDIPIS